MDRTDTAPRIVTLKDVPDLADRFRPMKRQIWPPFMFCDPHADRRWHYLLGPFARFQFYALNDAGEPVAAGHSIPCVWDGTMSGLPTGWDDALIRGGEDCEAGREANTLVGVEIAILPEFQRQGLSVRMIRALRAAAEASGFQALLFPVRPTLKSRYPLALMERYVRWTRADGEPFDPWLRVHCREGAEILKIGHSSMDIEASVEEWEEWAGYPMPESGEYIVDGALVPVQVDRVAGVGRYIEPNVWVHHPITTHRLLPV